MTNLIRAAVAAVCAGVFSTSAMAVVVDFDFYPGPDQMLGTADDVPVSAPTTFTGQTVQLTDQYASVGLLFTPDPPINNQNEILSNSTFSTPPSATDPNLLGSSGSLPITGMFTTGVDTLGALIGISGGSELMEVFDAGGTLIDSTVGDDVFVTLDPVAPIFSFRVTPFTGSGPAIDNLTFTFIPEPTSAALLAAGLLPLRRRR